MFALELKKALMSPGTLCALAVNMLLAAWQLLSVAVPYAFELEWEFMRTGSDGVYPPSLFNSWLGGYPYSLPAMLFFFLAPLAVCLPTVAPYRREILGGLADQMTTRGGTRRYYLAKLSSGVIAADAVILIPLIGSFLATACLVPAYPPEPAAGTFMVAPYAMLADLFYSNPYLYLLVYAVVTAVVCAVLVLVGMSLCRLLPNGFVATIAPFMLSVICEVGMRAAGVDAYAPSQVICPSPAGHADICIALAGYGLAALPCTAYHFVCAFRYQTGRLG